MAKLDIKQAYRNIPVHPKDRHLLGMLWKGEVFVDMVLPFRLRSAPLLSTAVDSARTRGHLGRALHRQFHYTGTPRISRM